MRQINNKYYMLFTSHWNINNKVIYIVNAYDAQNLYDERDRQASSILITDIIILAFSTIVISAISLYITRPIKVLNTTSKNIASGKFNERVNIKSKDEIGELAASFNIMATQIENKINELNLQVKQKNDFINGFTHELKTPMTAILGYTDLLRLRKCDEETTKKALNYIYSETKRLEKLSFKLIKLMGLSNEKIEFDSFNVFDLLNKAIKIEDIILKDNEIILDIEQVSLIGDLELLEVVMRNLIENAIKSDPKDKKVVIKGNKLENGRYKISVIDKGKGIPSEHIKRVTEDFYMVDKARSRQNGGSGIGLSLVKKILSLHETELVIDSTEGIGTEVSFELRMQESTKSF